MDDLSRKRLPIFVTFCANGGSSTVTEVANLNAFSEPFFKNGRSLGVAVDDDDDEAAAAADDDDDDVVLSTFP